MRFQQTPLYYICILFVILLTSFTQYPDIDSLEQELAKSLDAKKRVDLLCKLAGKYMDVDVEKMHKYIEEAESLIDDNEEFIMEKAQILSLRGNLKLKEGNLIEASRFYYNAINIYESQGEDFKVGSMYSNLGVLYLKNNQPHKADSIFTLGLNVLEGVEGSGKNKVINLILMNKGVTESMLQEYHKSISTFLDLVKVAEKEEDIEMKAKALHNIAKGYEGLNEIDNAIEYVLKAVELKKPREEKGNLISSYNLLAELYIKMEEYKTADQYLKESVIIAENYHSDEKILEIKQKMIDVASLRGEYERAYELLNEVNTEIIRQKDKERENLFQQLEHDFLKDREAYIELERRRERNLYLGGAVIVLVFTVLIVILLYRLQKQKIRVTLLKNKELVLRGDSLKNNIDHKNKELTTASMYLIQKNEMINNISKQLMDFNAELEDKHKRKINSIIKTLNDSSDSGQWEEFEIRFEQVHENFYSELQEKIPTITPNEKKLCAFLKLNFSTKDISSITKQSPKSIEQARYRLRKKVDLLGKDIDLNTFLAQIQN